MASRVKGGYSFAFEKTNWHLSNSPRLTRAVRDKMRDGVEQAGKIAIEKFKDIISEKVYDVYTPDEANGGYHRTGDFLDSWFFYIGNNMNRGDYFTTNFTLYQDSNSMRYNPDLYQHGSEISGDMRYAIAEFIFKGVNGGMFGDGVYSQPRDALSDFQYWLNKDFSKEIQNIMDGRGL